MSRALIFTVSAYSGWQRLLGLLPHRWQARRVARALVRSLGVIPGTGIPLVIQFPFGAFQVLDTRGRVEPCARAHVEAPR